MGDPSSETAFAQVLDASWTYLRQTLLEAHTNLPSGGGTASQRLAQLRRFEAELQATKNRISTNPPQEPAFGQDLLQFGQGAEAGSPSQIAELASPSPASDHSEHSLSKPWEDQASEKVDINKTLQVADPAATRSVRQRLQARLNTLSQAQLITGQQLHDAITALGLTAYNVEDMNELVNEIAAYIDLRFVKQQDAHSLPRARSSNSVFSAQENGDLGKAVWRWPADDKADSSSNMKSFDKHKSYDYNLVPAKALMDTFLAKDPELHRVIFNARLLKQFQAMREILLAGDTNRLVAELTFVRINDLAAPPEAVDALFYIEPVVCVLIFLNGIMIGFQTDPHFEHWSGWPYVELVFAIVLVLECLVRFCLSGGWRGFFCSSEWYWNTFDLFLVATAITDVAIQLTMQEASDMAGASLLRFCRLIRLVRVVKVFRLNLLKELRLMIKGLVGGIRTLMMAFALLVAVLYVIAGFATMTIGRDQRTTDLGMQKHFENIPQSMFTSFRCFSGECFADSGAPIASVLASVFGWPFVIGYVLSYMLVSMGIFNVILAVYVDITMRAAKETEATTAEQHSRESLRIARTTRELLKKFVEAYRIFHEAHDGDKNDKNDKNDKRSIVLNAHNSFTDDDTMHNIEITKELFLLVIQDQKVQKLMNNLDLPSDRANLFEVIDADGSGTLHVTELVQGLLKIRGDLTKSDTVATLLTAQAIHGILVELQEQQARFRDTMLQGIAMLSSVGRYGATRSPTVPQPQEAPADGHAETSMTSMECGSSRKSNNLEDVGNAPVKTLSCMTVAEPEFPDSPPAAVPSARIVHIASEKSRRQYM